MDPPDGVEQSDEDSKRKRNSRACIRCRFRHMRCPGGDPCAKCVMAKTKCEYVVYEKRLVVSRKYLNMLQEDIARLKKENAALRSSLHETSHKPQPKEEVEKIDIEPGLDDDFIHPQMDKYGRMIQLQTGEKVYVGLLSMTLFGLEIENMAPHYAPEPLPEPETAHVKRETKILEKEGNAYNITLAKTNTRPGLSVNFTLPLYLYAILLVDTFINYNDGCFYFFNEGLVKRFLMNLYAGNAKENRKITKRNQSARFSPAEAENAIKKDADDDTILETIWFCKILLIFAIGEMYLGTELDTHIEKLKHDQFMAFAKYKSKKRKQMHNTLPGSGFFYQALELFTGLFALGAIDNITKDGGIEVMLLYAFYLQVADCTIALYFYFGLALRLTLILGWHVDADMENLNRFELEHRRRIWWTVYMYERMLLSKAGLPLSFADDSVLTELPFDFKVDAESFPADGSDVRGYYIFPSAAYINNCVTITQINAIILSLLYTKQPKANILPVVSDLVQRLMGWKNALPDFLRVNFASEPLEISRLIVNLMTEYFQGMNLAVRPLLFHFATKKLRELQLQGLQYLDLSKYLRNVLVLLNASFQALINTVKCIWALLPQNMVALFGWMDREYLFTSASTLILFNASFGVHDATRTHLDHALTIFTKMKKLGNYPAALRRAQLLKLIRVLDFNGVMHDLLAKHDDTERETYFDPQPERGLDFLQFNNPVPGTTPASSRQTPEIPNLPSTGDANAQVFSASAKPLDAFPNADVFPNADLAGIEGLTYLDEEQKLWNEITHDAVWLQPSTMNPVREDADVGFGGGYLDIVNHEFR